MTQDGRYYIVHDVDTSALQNEEIINTQSFSVLFAEACSKEISFRGCRRKIRGNELAIMACCALPEDIVVALAAEVQTFLLNYDAMRTDSDKIDETRGSVVFSAVESAKMKLAAFESGEAKELIESVRFRSPVEQNTWRLYFQKELESENAFENRSLESIFKKERAWLRAVDLVLCTAKYSAHLIAPVSLCNDEAEFERLRADYKAAFGRFSALGDQNSLEDLHLEEAARVCEKVILQAESCSLVNMVDLLNLLDNAYDSLVSLLEEVCARLGRYGKILEMEVFDCVACISYDSCIDVNLVREEAERWRNNVLPIEGCSSSDILFVPDSLCVDHCGTRRAIWLIAKSGATERALVRTVASAVKQLLFEKGIGAKGTVFSRLAYPYTVKCPSQDLLRLQVPSFFNFARHFDDITFSESSPQAVVDIVSDSSLIEKTDAYCYAYERTQEDSAFRFENQWR